MKKTLLYGAGVMLVILCLAPLPGRAQGTGNIDWEELWTVMQPTSPS